MTKQELREIIANVQHKIWSHWMKYLFSVCTKNEDGSYILPAEKAIRWKRQMNTDYTELTDKEKDSDREMADWVLESIDKE